MEQTNLSQLFSMDQAELESLANAKNPNSEAAFVLGKLLLEGSSDKV